MFRFGDPGGRAYTSSTDILTWWTAASPATAAAPSVSAGDGRTTGSALLFSGNNSNYMLIKELPDNQSTLGIAFAIKITGFPTQTVLLASFGDGSTGQCDLRVGSDGQLIVVRNSGGDPGS